MVFAVHFPTEVYQMVDYLENRALSPLGKSIPQQVAGTLAFMDKAAAIPEDRRVSRKELWVATVAALEKEAQTVDNVRKKAHQPLVIMMISLELFMDSCAPVFARFIAWLMLLMGWGVFRADDVHYICPKRLILLNRCLRGILTRTKTTGPGKRVGEVVFFISRLVGFTHVDWMVKGFRLWQGEGIYKNGDFFIPLPNRDFSGSLPRRADSSAFSGLCKRVLAELKVPAWDGERWREGGEGGSLLLPFPLQMFWTGHGHRHWVPSVAAAVGLPKPEVDFVGRWGINEGQSHDYVLTSRQVCLKVQETVCQRLLEGPSRYDEDELIYDLQLFLRERQGGGDVEAELSHLRVLNAQGFLGMAFPAHTSPDVVGTAVEVTAVAEDHLVEATVMADGKDPVLPGPGELWMSVGKSGFRRLHQARIPGRITDRTCGIRPLDCYKFELCSGTTEKADKACRLCFNPSTLDNSSSSSSESSNSEVDTDDDGEGVSAVILGGSALEGLGEETENDGFQAPGLGTGELPTFSGGDADSDELALTE